MQPGARRLADVFARERARFIRFIDRRSFDDDSLDPEDILSEVILHLLQRSTLVAEMENLTAYIYRSLANRLTDHRRKSKPTLVLEDAPGALETETITLPDTRSRPDQTFALQELQVCLRTAIDQLGLKERAVWIATEIDGRSYSELSEEWLEPIGTLLSRKSRASARLRLLLADYKNHKELP
jgi:RNA polymerase sigma factor (sigma-70 family)